MKRRYIFGTLGALVAVLAIGAVACGDSDDGDGGDGGGSEASIRTEKGLTVANIAAIGGRESAGADDIAGVPAPRAPGSDGALFGGSSGPAGEAAAADVARIGGYGPMSFQVAGGGQGITVQGYATATADADSARLELYFSRYGAGPVPFPDFRGEPGPDGQDIAEAAPITEEELQPVIDALAGAGVSRDSIEYAGQGYYDPYYASATLRATIADLDSIEAVTAAAREAATGLADIEMTSSNVAYSVSDCSALETAALEAAIEDAGENADTFAAALGVTAGEIIGAANHSYYPYDGGSCESYWGFYPYFDGFGLGGPAEVQVFAQVAITYAIQ